MQGSPKVIRGLADEGKEYITGVWTTYHDDQEGKARGKSATMIFEAEGLRVVHLGPA